MWNQNDGCVTWVNEIGRHRKSTKMQDFPLFLKPLWHFVILDKRVAEILRVKFWLGLFDNPYRGNGKQAEQIVHSKEHQAVSLEAARQSLVLLKILFPTRRIAH